jgi:ribonucleoside-triphosphate reductase
VVKVIKHDGRVEDFDHSKIDKAVAKAAEEVGVDTPNVHLSYDDGHKGVTIVGVDTIHDDVERELMKLAPAVAKAYILYREKRTEVREGKSELMQTVGKLIEEMNHDNANTGNSAASKMYGIAEAASKRYYLSHMNPKWAENHRKGRAYMHDLGYHDITFNCFFNPIGKMLEHGFNNGVGMIRSPKRIGSAMALVAIILQSSQNDMYGGQGVLNFDSDLAPYVTKEYNWQLKNLTENIKELCPEQGTNKAAVQRKAWELTEKAVYQAMEAFVYNMNTMRSRSGAQVTFSSVNFGLDTSKEGKMISRNLLKAYIAGLGNGENPIFPNLCYRLMDGVNLNEGEPNFDLTQLAIECMGKRIQPRFVFCDSPAYPNKYEAGTMGCRTAVRSNVNGSSTPEARGNLAFTTLNLPYIALEAKRNVINKHLLVNEFFRLYNILIDDAIDELHARYDIIKNLKVKDVPFVSDWYQGHEGLTPNDTIEPMVKNGTLSVGFIGLAEALTVLIGKHHGESEQAQRLGLQIVYMLRKKMDKETAKSHLNWSCFATPAESACYTLLNAIKREFGVVKGVSDKDYLTNSCHVPVSFKCDMKTKIDIEAPYHLLCNAGAIFYIEAPSSPKFNPEGCLHLLQYMAKSGIVYGGLNYEHDFCVDCGEQGTFNVCPKCGSKNIRMTKIITGYLSTSDKFNPGKVAEARDRVSHT